MTHQGAGREEAQPHGQDLRTTRENWVMSEDCAAACPQSPLPEERNSGSMDTSEPANLDPSPKLPSGQELGVS